MKSSSIAILAALGIGGYLYLKSNGKGLQSVFDNLSNWLSGVPSSGLNSPSTNAVITSGTPAGVLDKNSIPPSSNPAIVAQVNALKANAIQLSVDAANWNVAHAGNIAGQNWTPAVAAQSIANAQQANANYWASKGFS
jgi:hypothetical protein